MDFFSDNSFANRKKHDDPDAKFDYSEIKHEDSKQNSSEKPKLEESKNQASSEANIENESKKDEDIENNDHESNINPSMSEAKEDNEDQKPENPLKRKDDQKKFAFKQFEFKVYNDYKQYPLYHILSKTRLLDDNNESKDDIKSDIKQEENVHMSSHHSNSNKNMSEENSEHEDNSEHEENSEHEDNSMKSEHESKHEMDLDKIVEKAEADNQDNKDNEQKMEGEDEDINNEDSEEESEIRYGKKRYDPVLEDYEKLTFDQRQKLSVDEVCGIYLREVSQKVNTKFYKTLLKFVILFRECCNEYGWQKVIEVEKLLADEKIKLGGNAKGGDKGSGQSRSSFLNDLSFASIPTASKNTLQQQQMIIISDIAQKSRDGHDEFAKVNSAEHAPEVCNEFVTIFLEHREEYIDRGDAIDLTLNF